MAEEIKTPSAEDQIDLAMLAEKVKRMRPQRIAVCGKTYKVRRIGSMVAAKIASLAFDSLYYERESKSQGLSLRMAKRLNEKNRQIPSKTAAYYILGNYALFVPFLYAIYWRLLWLRNDEVTSTINSAGAGNGDVNFYLANSEFLSYQLVLSMRGVGESVRQMLERKESAESMLDEDASSKKEEDSKSTARSNARRTTKR